MTDPAPDPTPNSVFVPGTASPADDLTQAWWDAATERRLTVETCAACGNRQHPPRGVCTACSSTEHLGQADVAGTGTIDSFTVVHRAPRADLEVPYVLARVRLGEGPVLLTRLVGGLEWRIGQPVTVAWADLPDGRALPYFTRIPDSQT
ncbi:OB-fold domain-containing protein [Nocardioides sp. zg-536]|uniref:OB-fold domain-containing protein n=1 Tax=Nocardioides faecalis TaxID=2803858 RepID=A0A939BS10_9ACTN|nr:OB-fold domain-containing protein [Nocardioides faecalis]MBM9459159.1 OB-fold domain-containing protein [Nocardioides faecalis]QVI59699.1 OB-fold domain-containing protein [Nocardioides faecalis]